MSQANGEQSDRGGGGPYQTAREVLEELERREITVPKWTFSRDTLEVYYVIGEYDESAGEHVIDGGATLAEWEDCPDADTVFQAVALGDLNDVTGIWEDVEDVRDDVQRGRLLGRSVPDSVLLPLVEPLVDKIEGGRIEL